MTTHAQTAARDLARIEEAVRSGDQNGAIDLAIAALGRNLEHPVVLRLVARGLLDDDRAEDAAALLHRATVVAPDDVQSWTDFGLALALLHRHAEALAAYQSALALAPDGYDAQVGAGALCLRLNDPDGMRRHYTRAAQIAPNEAEPLSALAVLAGRQGDYRQARALAMRALTLRPDFIAAQIALARADIGEGAAGLAEARLEPLVRRTDIDGGHRLDALGAYGEALDALDRPAEAFAAFEAANGLQKSQFAAFLESPERETSSEQSARLNAYFTDASPDAWRGVPGADREGEGTARGHVFLIGFPRSGTTLLEQVLASHPQVVALDEKAMLAEAADPFLVDESALGELATLGEAGARTCREAYWRSVREALRDDLAGDLGNKVFIDKNPLHTVKLPLIAKLFPDAKILFARRDPRDVVLSCFRQRFRMNTAMAEFLTLEDAARYYDQVMSLADVYAAKLRLDVHHLRHEDVVADFDGEIRKALAFIDLEWDPAVRDFAVQARAVSSTPSVRQVAQGLNAAGVGRWRRYERQMAPVLPRLAPWAARFGYPPAGGDQAPAPRTTRRETATGARDLVEIAAAASRPETRGRAIDLAIRALGGGIEDVLVLQLVIEGLEADGRLHDAAALAQRVTEVAPALPEAWTEFSRLLRKFGRPWEGLDAVRPALRLDPQSYTVQLSAAAAFLGVNEFSDAAGHARQAANIRGNAAEPLSILATIAARRGDFADARGFADRALALRPDSSAPQIVLARADLAGGHASLATERLQRLLARPELRDARRAEALGALGDALDAADDPGSAFGAYAAAKSVLSRQATASGAPSPSAVEHARDLERYFRAADPALWAAGAGGKGQAGPGVKGHVFLLGFPRSGTTLLENALASHPGVVALEEADALIRCGDAFMNDAAALDRLASLTDDEASACRDVYWARVRELTPQPVKGKVFIDKMPIHTIALPVIAKLFPEAKILFARRDPRDVTLSCFRRLFGINSVTAEFITLEGAARYYDQVMRLAEVFEHLLPLDFHFIRHEDIVADFDRAVGAALAFMGLAWDPTVRDFAVRGVNAKTPSAGQVARGLNAEGVGAWKRYAGQMAPALPILAPWAARFGYPPAMGAEASTALTTGGEVVTGTPNLAEIEAAARTDRNHAIDLAIKAFGAGLADPLVLRLVADGLEEDGRPQDAGDLLTRARAAAARDVGVLTQFGRLLARIGRPGEALAMQREALDVDPDSYDAHVGAGAAGLTLNDIAGAKGHFQRAHEIAPGAAEPLSALAVIAAREGDPQAARAFAERALTIRPDLVRAQMAIARADTAEKAPALAEARLKRLLARPDLAEDDRADASGDLADALDALDRPAEAFAAYDSRNARLARLYAPTVEANVPERRVDEARRLAAYFENAPEGPWRTPAGEDREGPKTARGHVFLMGFPRSGTTLLEQALASHPGVVALEEKAILSRAAGHLLSDDAAVDRLAILGESEADEVRAAYWRGVREAFGEDISGQVFIDKLPLHTPALPLIAKLFPGARIIFARRDPRDVVLSCFRRRFLLNAAMYEYLTLDGAARYYDQTMALAELYFAKLPLEVHVVRNEDLVADFEGETRATLRFIGVDWDPAVWNFPARAAAQSDTPSADQVARGLNAEGVGQWRRYEAQLAPVLSLLEPWAARFGYPSADPTVLPAEVDPRMSATVAQVGAALQAGDWPRAFALVDAAFTDGLRHPLFFRLRGVRAQQEGRLDQAIADFEAAVAEQPGDFATLSALGLCLARNGRLAEGVARLDASIAVNPQFAPAHYNRGWALENMGDLAGASEAYGRAVAIDPRHAQALGNLAVIAARAADWPQARRLAGKALEFDPAQPVALTALANAEAAGGDLAAAEWRLRVLLADGNRAGPHERAVAFNALGDVLDRLERPRDAFTAYEAAGALFRNLYASRFTQGGAETSLGAARRLAGYFDAADGSDWRRSSIPAKPREATGHVFLVGFPRSGTTMLGQALGGHGDAVTLDEADCLAEAVASFLRDPEALARLAAVTAAEIDHHRDLYWRRVGAAGAAVAGKVFIDKRPMNILALPLIVKLFPDARVLVMRRDPRDVVLSAFRRRFVINPTTVELLSLEGAASLYTSVMELAEIYGAKLEFTEREQSFEALVQNFEGQMQAICEFAGLTWRPGLAAFADRAGAVATPSGAQLARGLNAEGVGHWRRYKDDLAPVLPVLAPWVKRFGYPTS